MEMEMEGGTP